MKSEVEKSFPRTGYGAVKMKHRSFRICFGVFCLVFYQEVQSSVTFTQEYRPFKC